MNESFSQTIAHLQEQMKPLEEQLRAKKRLVNDLCLSFGSPPIYPDSDLLATSATSAVRPDQYFGRPLATVVREILERRKTIGGGAISLSDLFDAMKAGGFEFAQRDDKDARTSVATTLGKNAAFIKVPNTGHWGLADWYPGAKRNRPDDEKSEKTTAKPETASSNDATPDASTSPNVVPA